MTLYDIIVKLVSTSTSPSRNGINVRRFAGQTVMVHALYTEGKNAVLVAVYT